MPSFIQKTLPVLLTLFISVAASAESIGSIIGYNFYDGNSNAIDDSETRLPGFTLVVTSLEGGTPVQMSDLTDVTGSFSFENLPLQKYLVCEVLPANSKWITTTEQCVQIELTEDNSNVALSIGNRPKVETDLGCTYQQSFWSNSIQGELLLRFLMQPPDTMIAGLNKYKLSEVNRILDEPVASNALLTLSHQLITAKINIMNGANANAIAATVANADAAIGALALPPFSTNYIDSSTKPGINFLYLATQLERFNLGQTQIPACK